MPLEDPAEHLLAQALNQKGCIKKGGHQCPPRWRCVGIRRRELPQARTSGDRPPRSGHEQNELVSAPIRIDRHDSVGSGWNDTSRGTRVPTEIEKLTLVTGATCSSLITVVILVRCPLESFAAAPACPVVWALLSVAPFDSAFMLPLRSSRPSAFMPLRSSRPWAFMSLPRLESPPSHALRIFIRLVSPALLLFDAPNLSQTGSISFRISLPSASTARQCFLGLCRLHTGVFFRVGRLHTR